MVVALVIFTSVIGKNIIVVHFIVLISYPIIFLVSPIFEHKCGNVPISIFGNPFVIIGTDVRHCLHGSEKVQRIFTHLSNYFYSVTKVDQKCLRILLIAAE